MHNLSQFLVINGDRRKKKKTPRKPKLERMNAKKNIDYEFPTTSTSSSSEEPASVRLRSAAIRGTRSLDLPSLGDGTSLRIDGSDVGQLEIIYRRLGLENPEDFGIPVSSWEARKIRSTSDLIPRSPLNFETDHGTNAVEHEQPAENAENRRDDIIRVTSAAVEHTPNTVRVSGSNRVGNGIKGVRPPLLSPPSPSISKPLMHHDTGCEWDTVRTFPSLEGSSAHVNQQGFRLHDEEEADVENVRTRLEGATLSGSCSFTTSNEDDSSSSTTEPASSISPNGYGSNISTNGRFRHIAITHWQRGELLGRGSFGSVYEGICDGGYFIAVKEVSLLDQGELGRQSVLQLEQEIALLSQFEHENIVRYYGTDKGFVILKKKIHGFFYISLSVQCHSQRGSFAYKLDLPYASGIPPISNAQLKDASKLYIFLELVTKGSLLSLYRRYHLQDCQVSSYTRQILHGLKYLHDQSVVHRDVKCANILVDANGSVKLADFGLAKATKLNDVKSCKGTAFWMAPEVVNLKNNGYGLAADIWSLGCTVLEMLTRQIPYSPLECMPALFRIGRGLPPPIPNSLSREARDFISQCLHVNPRDRPTATQLLDHPFVRRPLPSFSDSVSGHPWKRQT